MCKERLTPESTRNADSTLAPFQPEDDFGGAPRLILGHDSPGLANSVSPLGPSTQSSPAGSVVYMSHVQGSRLVKSEGAEHRTYRVIDVDFQRCYELVSTDNFTSSMRQTTS